jgi:tRNA(Ile)-lysidine synthase
MIPPEIRLGVAVSGGADSVFLLRFLAARGKNPLVVLHVNHGLRGADSDADAAFTRELAAGLDAGYREHRMGAVRGNLEQFCRRERLAFFAAAIGEGLVDRVATGHTASDQAETVLMRLLRGAGTTGLRGVLPVTRERLVRPLLAVSRAEIREWLAARGFSWREDASNETAPYLRNRVRAALRDLAPESEAALGRVAELAALDEEYWAGQVEASLEGEWVRGGLVLDRRRLAEMHPALLGRVIRRAVERAFGSLRRVDRAHVERVAELIRSGRGEGAVEVPGGRVERSLDWVRFGGTVAGAEEFTLPGEGEVGEVLVRAWRGGPDGYTGEIAAELDWERLRPPLRLTGWRPGDRMQSVGNGAERTLKEMFARRRVPSWNRASWPMIRDSAGIVWSYQFGAAARAAATPRTAVRLFVRCDTVSSK